MMISGASANSPFDRAASMAQQLTQSVRQEFEQLGRDLQAGNLKAAQSDFATIEASSPLSDSSISANPTQASASSQGLNMFRSAFAQLSQDLRSGDIAAARQDYAALQQDMRNLPSNPSSHGFQASVTKELGSLGQLVTQVPQMLPGNYLSAALQAYGLFAQNLPENTNSTSAPSGTSLPMGASSTSVTA